MTEPLCVCSRCNLTGYYLTDIERGLCHNCVRREQINAERLDDLRTILTNFKATYKAEYWIGCNFGKAFIGNALIQAVNELEERL